MSERRLWTSEEDNILQKLFEVDGIKKWSEISKVMEDRYRIVGRSGKQCRERYHNHLRGGIKTDKWSPEEEEKLVELHAQFGNRWSQISKIILGRPQNCIKNMLYSKMRKSVRQLNRFAYVFFRKELKEIKLAFVNRLIDITESAYKKGLPDRNQTDIASIDIKNGILMLKTREDHSYSEEQKQKIRSLIDSIHNFKKNNRKHQRKVTMNKIKKQKMRQEKEQDVICLEPRFSGEDSQSIVEKKIVKPRKNRKAMVPEAWISRQQSSVESKEEDEIEESEEQQDLEKIDDIVKKPSEKYNSSSTDSCNKKDESVQENDAQVFRVNEMDDQMLNLCEVNDLDLPIQTSNLNLNMTPEHQAINRDDLWIDDSPSWKLQRFGYYF